MDKQMTVREDILKYAAKPNKPILLFLLDKYHLESEWRFVAKPLHVGAYPRSYVVWVPKLEGLIIYNFFHKGA